MSVAVSGRGRWTALCRNAIPGKHASDTSAPRVADAIDAALPSETELPHTRHALGSRSGDAVLPH